MKVAVSGARGLVGRRLLGAIEQLGAEAVPLVRHAPHAKNEIAIGDLAETGEIELPRVDAVVHLAARVHVMHERDQDPLSAYRRVNVNGTCRLLEGAYRAGARRFVFVSTIKVLGEETLSDRPFTQDSPPMPQDPYAVSKLEAERAVIDFCERRSMEWSIVRPVLVHGPGVGGNFAQIMRLVRLGVPLPLGGIRNERSLISVGSLAAFLAEATRHPYLAGRTVNLADEPALSTPDLVRSLARAMRRPARLISMPATALERVASLAGQGERVRRLTRSLCVDTSGVFQEMPWRPPVSWDEALQETVADALRHR